ncbi:hypothetical protein GCM10011419_28610 [Vogesella fluminis]|uniref:ATP-grasp domain-containing protein n=2 Tax=Vogesella fluminis TaxID=1069161 RepID=A0ABQ3HCF0_9NEIS|nr:hypothetical protein GCM10011419_28610 [Vogesella fluminis]
MEADIPVELDLNDEETVVAKVSSLATKFAIQGVFTLNEYRIPLAARIAEALGLSRGLSYEAALNCRHKQRTRALLAAHKVGSPAFCTVKMPAEALGALRDMPCPVVVKPSNDAGSNQVIKCETPDEVWDAVTAIGRQSTNWVGQPRNPEILIEEYLDGPEFSVESCTSQGVTTVIAITQKTLDAEPSTTEIQHLVPAPIQPKVHAQIAETVSQALTALGVDNAVTHTEIRLTAGGPKIVEVNARPGGDKIPVLVRTTTGVDLHELSMHLSLGESYETYPRGEGTAGAAAIRFFTAPKAGVIRYRVVANSDGSTRLLDLSWYMRSGDTVPRTTSNYNRLGHCLIAGDSAPLVIEAIDAVERDIALTVE